MSAMPRSRFHQLQVALFAIGLVALALMACGYFVERRQFFFSYTFGWLAWFGLSVGCFLVLMIHHLAGGRWGYPTRRFFEAGSLVLPLMLVLFIPLCFGRQELYPGARPAEVASEPVLAHRQSYMAAWAFILRGVIIIAIFATMALFLRKWSLKQDHVSDAAPARKARALSAPGLILVTILGTFAYVDWFMSLEKHWHSSIFGIIVFGGQILAAYAFAILLLAILRHQEPLGRVLTKTHFHHLGNLLLTFVLFWTYVSFGQLLIIYSGDLPHELDWYLHRIAGAWKTLVFSLAVFHFFVPFFLLLFRAVKLHVASLAAVAGLLLVAQMVHVYWLVMPSLHQHDLSVSWMDLVAPLGIGGLWISYFLYHIRRAPLLPQHDPGLQFAFTYGR